MKFQLVLLCVLSLSALSCATSDRKQDSFDSNLAEGFSRKPSSIDYISEIESANNSGWIASLEADHDILQFQARFRKLFALASTDSIAMFSQMRAQRPVFLIPGVRGKVLDPSAMIGFRGISKFVDTPTIAVVTRYDDVTEVIHNYTAFTVQAYAGPIDDIGGAPYMLARDATEANEQKPDMKRSIDGKSREAQIRNLVDHVASAAIHEGADNGKIDIVASVTRSVPLGINENYFGITAPDRGTLARWSKDSHLDVFYNPEGSDSIKKNGAQAGAEMRDYIKNTLIPERLSELSNGRPADDVVSRILSLSELHARYGVNSSEVIVNLIGMLVGSVETTSAAITQSLSVILSHPHLRDQTIQAARSGDDALLSKIVWEALRFKNVNHWVARVAQADTIIARGTDHETLILKGSLVLASTESAMFDETQFPEPYKFKLDRDFQKYLIFGYEYHKCLGQDVASVMVPETIKQILKLKDVAIGEPLGSTAPFPEKFVLSFDPAAVLTRPKFAPTLTSDRLDALTYSGFSSSPKSTQDLRATVERISGTSPQLRAAAVDELPDKVEAAMGNFSEQERVTNCENKNMATQALFPLSADRHNFCALRSDFRVCYLVSRVLQTQASSAAYNFCAYAKSGLTDSERADFIAKFQNGNEFFFLNNGTAHAH